MNLKQKGSCHMNVLDSFKLDKKKAFVTGGAQGIGKEIVTALAEAGADVAIIDLNDEKAEKSAQEIADQTAKNVIAFKADVTDPDQVKKAVDHVVDTFGSLDIAVNNAGMVSNTPSEDEKVEDWQKIVDLNLTGVFLCSQAAGNAMLETGGGSIINIGSMSGSIINVPQPQAAYNSTKAAVIHLSKSLAVEWAEKNVRVNTISPGYMNTELLQAEELDPLKEQWKELTPMKRIGEPSELKGVAVYLASEASTFTTGSDFIIDGGYTSV